MNLSLLLLAATTGSTVTTLHVQPSAWSVALAKRLKAERPELRLVQNASTARYVVVLRPVGRRAHLEVLNASGAPVLDRRLTLSPSSDAGLRVAALLVLRAVDHPDRGQPPATVTKTKVLPTARPRPPATEAETKAAAIPNTPPVPRAAPAPRSPLPSSRAQPPASPAPSPSTRARPPASPAPSPSSRARPPSPLVANAASSRPPPRPSDPRPPPAQGPVVTVPSPSGPTLPAAPGPWVLDIGAGMRLLPTSGAPPERRGLCRRSRSSSQPTATPAPRTRCPRCLSSARRT